MQSIAYMLTVAHAIGGAVLCGEFRRPLPGSIAPATKQVHEIFGFFRFDLALYLLPENTYKTRLPKFQIWIFIFLKIPILKLAVANKRIPLDAKRLV